VVIQYGRVWRFLYLVAERFKLGDLRQRPCDLGQRSRIYRGPLGGWQAPLWQGLAVVAAGSALFALATVTSNEVFSSGSQQGMLCLIDLAWAGHWSLIAAAVFGASASVRVSRGNVRFDWQQLANVAVRLIAFSMALVALSNLIFSFLIEDMSRFAEYVTGYQAVSAQSSWVVTIGTMVSTGAMFALIAPLSAYKGNWRASTELRTRTWFLAGGQLLTFLGFFVAAVSSQASSYLWFGALSEAMLAAAFVLIAIWCNTRAANGNRPPLLGSNGTDDRDAEPVVGSDFF